MSFDIRNNKMIFLLFLCDSQKTVHLFWQMSHPMFRYTEAVAMFSYLAQSTSKETLSHNLITNNSFGI